MGELGAGAPVDDLTALDGLDGRDAAAGDLREAAGAEGVACQKRHIGVLVVWFWVYW
jgi:hypothetical protein